MLRGSKLAVAASVLLALAACKKDSPPKGKLEGLAKTAVDTVPRDTAILFGLNWSRLKESRLYDKVVELLRKERELTRRLAALDAACGVDPVRELDAVVAANSVAMDDTHAILFVKGNWDQARAAECLSGYWQSQYFHTLVPKEEDGLTAYAVDGTAPKLYAHWAAKDTVVFAPKNLHSKEFLADVVAKKSSVREDKGFMDLLGRVDTTATYWLAMSAATSPAFQSAFAELSSGAEARPLGLYLSIDLTRGLDATIGLRFAAERDAKEIARKAGQELKAFREQDPDWAPYLADVGIQTVGSDVVFRVKLSEKKLEELVTAFEEFLPAIGKVIRDNLAGG